MRDSPDAIVVGAGPAGCVAAIVLARAGLRVRLLDRAVFPRDKLCGDTLNPGALAVLRRLNLPAAASGLRIDGMLVTGTRGVRVAARYPHGIQGRALLRRELDLALVRLAAEAGVSIDEGVLAQRLVIDSARRLPSGAIVRGVAIRSPGGAISEIRGRLVIAADGRESRLARQAGLARSAAHPRRWAIGAHFSDVSGMSSLGEMHVRPGHYIGVAPLPGGIANACVVCSDRRRLRDPSGLLTAALAGEQELRERFQSARMIRLPTTLGPLAVECPVPGMPGLLLAGDAAGFIDPMTGDGLRFALRGAELAAIEGLRALERGSSDAHERLAARRRREFAGKWRFNRALRRLVDSAAAVRAASRGTRLSSWPVARIIGYAADLGAA